MSLSNILSILSGFAASVAASRVSDDTVLGFAIGLCVTFGLNAIILAIEAINSSKGELLEEEALA